MKKTEKSTNGTSFHDVKIITTVNELIRVLGEPTIHNNTGKNKVNFEWDCETEDGDVVTIYDWKEYRVLGLDEHIEFHLGGHDLFPTLDAKDKLKALLNK